MQPLFSIITPFYNSEIYLERLLESLNKQQYKNFELLLINDGGGSSDLIAQMLSKYQDQAWFKYFSLATNQGAAASRNFALQQAQGTWIIFIDSDDLVNDKYLQLLADNIASHPDLVMLISDLKRMEESGRIKKALKQQIDPLFSVDQLDQQSYWRIFSRFIFRSDILKQYSIQFPLSKLSQLEDHLFTLNYELVIRKFYPQSKIAFCKDSTYYYTLRDNASSLTDQALIKVADNIAVLKAVYLPLIKLSYQYFNQIPQAIKDSLQEILLSNLKKYLIQAIPEIQQQLAQQTSYSLSLLKYILIKLNPNIVNELTKEHPALITFIAHLLNSDTNQTRDDGTIKLSYSSQILECDVPAHDKFLKRIPLTLGRYNYGTKSISQSDQGSSNFINSLISNTTFMSDQKLDLNSSYAISKGLIREVNFAQRKKITNKIKLFFTKNLIIDYRYFTQLFFINNIDRKISNSCFMLYVKYLDHDNYLTVAQIARNNLLSKLIIAQADPIVLIKFKQLKLLDQSQIKLLF